MGCKRKFAGLDVRSTLANSIQTIFGIELLFSENVPSQVFLPCIWHLDKGQNAVRSSFVREIFPGLGTKTKMFIHIYIYIYIPNRVWNGEMQQLVSWDIPSLQFGFLKKGQKSVRFSFVREIFPGLGTKTTKNKKYIEFIHMYSTAVLALKCHGINRWNSSVVLPALYHRGVPSPGYHGGAVPGAARLHLGGGRDVVVV